MQGLISRHCLATAAGAARGLKPNALRQCAFSMVVGPHVTPVDKKGPATPSFSSLSAEEPPRLGQVLGEALKATTPRSDWTKDEVREVYNTPLLDLVHYSVCTFSCAPLLFSGSLFRVSE